MSILGFILGLFLAVSFAYAITIAVFCLSNNVGDSEGTFNDFSKDEMHYISKKKWK